MVNKILAGIVVLLMAATNVYAMELKNGNWISHKETSSNLISSFSFKDTNSDVVDKTGFVPHTLTDNITYNISDSLSSINMAGKITAPVTIGAVANFTATNNSPAFKLFSVATSLCVSSPTFPGQCVTASDNYTLGYGGVLVVNRTPSLTLSITTAGTYTTNIITYIYDEQNTSVVYQYQTAGTLTMS